MRKEITIEDLKAVMDNMKNAPIDNRMHIIDSIAGWKMSREGGWCFAQWSNKEIENYNKDTRLIGTKCGIDCYVKKI